MKCRPDYERIAVLELEIYGQRFTHDGAPEARPVKPRRSRTHWRISFTWFRKPKPERPVYPAPTCSAWRGDWPAPKPPPPDDLGAWGHHYNWRRPTD